MLTSPSGERMVNPGILAGSEAGAIPARSRDCVRFRQTAALLGLDRAAIEPGLADCDFGRWRGESLQTVQDREPEAVGAWMQDPGKSPHGGESILALIDRIGAWLERQAPRRGVTLAFTHAAVIRAAMVAALEAEAQSLWRIDIAPLSLAPLAGHAGRWNIVGLRHLADAE
jgi:broad specificity phosphatase PhoE